MKIMMMVALAFSLMNANYYNDYHNERNIKYLIAIQVS